MSDNGIHIAIPLERGLVPGPPITLPRKRTLSEMPTVPFHRKLRSDETYALAQSNANAYRAQAGTNAYIDAIPGFNSTRVRGLLDGMGIFVTSACVPTMLQAETVVGIVAIRGFGGVTCALSYFIRGHQVKGHIGNAIRRLIPVNITGGTLDKWP